MRWKQWRPSGDWEMPSCTMSCGGMRVMSCPSKRIAPVAGGLEPGDRAQRGGLAGAVRADERDELALLDLHRDALERLDVAVVGVDVVDLEQRHRPSPPPPRPACRGRPRRRAGRAHLGGRALGDLLAVVEHGDVLGDPHDELHVVLDEEDREAALVAQAAHELRRSGRLLRVHPRRGLVEQEQLGVGGQRAGDLEPALVAVGEVGRHDVEELRRAGRRRRAARAPSRAPRAPPGARAACEDRAEEPRLRARVLADHDSSRPPSSSRTGGCSGRSARRRAT